MKPAQFIYRAPDRLEDVLGLLADEDRDARVIAGGQSLVPMMNFRLSTPELLVDLRRVEALRGLRREPDGSLVVGATVTQAQLLRDPVVARDFPVLAAGVAHVGHPQIRSRGTVCGSLAHHDPTAELPALALALDARMTVQSAAGGSRELSADAFLVSYYETALEPGELLTAVTFPALAPRAGWSFRELARRRGDFALVGAIALAERGGGAGGAAGANGDAAGPTARLVLFGVGDRAVRLPAVERLWAEAVPGEPASAPPSDALQRQVRELVAAAIEPVDDVHASAEYRREIAGELACAALAEAWERAA